MVSETRTYPVPEGLSTPTMLPDAEQPSISPVESLKAQDIGGRDGLDPTRYGDWEKNGRCIDF